MGSPTQCRRGLTGLVRLYLGNLPIREEQHAVGNTLDTGVMRDDERCRPELRIDTQQSLDNANACLGIQRAGWFITKQDFGPLGDRTGDCHALLFAA